MTGALIRCILLITGMGAITAVTGASMAGGIHPDMFTSACVIYCVACVAVIFVGVCGVIGDIERRD